LQRDEERLLVVKTNSERFEALRLALVELHPYEIPELIATRIEAGHGPYLEWFDRNLRGDFS
jgi:periplasmic divalent cation tolerance protein